jgi:DNA primase
VIPDSFKQDLLNRVDIVDVVSRHVQLKKAGANHLGLCPFHGEKTPSFSVSPAKQFYHCFGCGAHGNAIGFLMAYASMGYVDAVKDLAASAGMQVPDERPPSPQEAARKERETDLYAVMEQAMEFYRGALKKAPGAIEYLKGRGLTGEVAARFRVGYAPDDWQGLKAAFPEYSAKSLVECGLVIENEGKRYDRFRDRIMFPIHNARGAVIGFGGRIISQGDPKYMNSPETALFEKGREVYGLVQARDAIRAAGRALVVEGYMDVVALAQYGIGYSVATLGTATTPVHVSKLLRLADELVFCFDGDTAGRKAAWRALEVSLPLAPDHKPIRFLFLPESDDPDSYVRRHGKEGFEGLLARAQTLSEFLLGELRSQSQLDTAEGRARFLSLAKPYVQKLAAPALRIQIINAVAELGRISDQEVRQLMEVAPVERFRRPAPARPRATSNSSPEWSLLYSLLIDLPMVVHLEPALLRVQHPETRALLALRELVGAAEDEPSVGALLERLEGNPSLELVLQASRYGDELGFTQEDARGEIQAALAKLDVLRRQAELDAILGQGLRSKEDQLAYQRKLMDFKRLQGALRPETREQA